MPLCPRKSAVHNYIGGPRGKKIEVLCTNETSSPLSVFLLHFAEIITLLIEKINQYHHYYLDTLDDDFFPALDITEAEMFAFLAITIQTGHCI